MDAARELASCIDSPPRADEVALSRIHAGCLVLMLREAAAVLPNGWVDFTHPDVGVRIVGPEVTPAERALIVERVLLKERVAALALEVDGLLRRLLEQESNDRASIVAFLTTKSVRFDQIRALRRDGQPA